MLVTIIFLGRLIPATFPPQKKFHWLRGAHKIEWKNQILPSRFYLRSVLPSLKLLIKHINRGWAIDLRGVDGLRIKKKLKSLLTRAGGMLYFDIDNYYQLIIGVGT